MIIPDTVVDQHIAFTERCAGLDIKFSIKVINDSELNEAVWIAELSNGYIKNHQKNTMEYPRGKGTLPQHALSNFIYQTVDKEITYKVRNGVIKTATIFESKK